LSSEAKKLWRDLHTEYDLTDPGALTLVKSACESLDMLRKAEAAIDEYGVVVTGQAGTLKANPACAVARDARSQMLQSLKALNLDIEPLNDRPGRPAGS
jgi:P27 family predicted phage terminase small subunit